MVFLLLGEITLKTGIFAATTLYNGVCWMIYGKQKSDEQKLLEKIADFEKREIELMENSQKQIQELKDLIVHSKLDIKTDYIPEEQNLDGDEDTSVEKSDK